MFEIFFRTSVGVPAQQRKQTCLALIQKYGSRSLIIAIRPRSADCPGAFHHSPPSKETQILCLSPRAASVFSGSL